MIDTPPEPLAAQEQTIERKMLDCGLKAGGFTVRYEGYLDGIEVVISPAAGVTADQFGCIREATFPEFVRFEDYAVGEQYGAFADEQVRPKMLAEAEAELRKLGLWEGFPDRANYASLADYVRALEVHAGWAPGSALMAQGEDTIVFNPPRQSAGPSETTDGYKAILVVMMYAGADARLKMGFIGNDKVAE